MIGKILGCYFGYALTAPMGHGLVGIIVGWWIGSQFDNSIRPQRRRSSFYFNINHTSSQKVFFNSTFAIMGHVAKFDGVVSQQEIGIAKSFMEQLGLGIAARKEAIAAFNRGKESSFNLDQELQQLFINYRSQPLLLRMFIDVQNRAASVDGMSPEKINLMNHICRRLGFSDMYHSNFNKSDSHNFTSGQSLARAYDLLGVSQTCSNEELKKSYRKMLGKHHPDRLVAKGLPQEMIKVANQKTIEINKAYQLIIEHRRNI